MTGSSALHYAVQEGHTGIVRMLASARGSDNNLADSPSAKSPLMLAAHEGHLDCVRALLAHTAVRLAAVRQVSKENGQTALAYALRAGHLSSVVKLLHAIDAVGAHPFAGTDAVTLTVSRPAIVLPAQYHTSPHDSSTAA